MPRITPPTGQKHTSPQCVWVNGGNGDSLVRSFIAFLPFLCRSSAGASVCRPFFRGPRPIQEAELRYKYWAAGLSVTGIPAVCPVLHQSDTNCRTKKSAGVGQIRQFSHYAVAFAGTLLQLLPVKNAYLTVPRMNHPSLLQPAYRRSDG